MSESIRVHLYQVLCGANTPDIQTVFHEAVAVELVDRLQIVGHQEVRLEAIAAPRSRTNSSSYWLFDFTRLRFEHGPGKASRTQEIEGFELGSEEGFGEETAALYDPKTGYILIQYNHFGVRAGSIQHYFSFFNTNAARSYEFRVKLDNSSELKLAQKQILTKIHFKVAAANMTSQQRHAGVSLGRALDLSDSLNGQSIEVVVSAGRGLNSMLASNKVRNLIDTLRTLVTQGTVGTEPVVEKFEVVGKATVDDRAEAIDMLTPKLEQSIDGVVLGKDLRYTRESRWGALLRARNGWQTTIEH